MQEIQTQSFLCVCAPTCMFVVGRGLWPFCAAALLEEEGGTFDHEEALAEAGKHTSDDLRMNTWHSRAVIFYSVGQLMPGFHQLNQN